MKTHGIRKFLTGMILIALYFSLNGCASVPMASLEQDAAMKEFPSPRDGMAGLYIYRDSSFGFAIVDNISLDDEVTGKLPVNTFIYRDLTPGPHTLSIPTEFASYKIDLEAESGKSYFAHYYIRMGVFRGNGALKIEDENTAKDAIVKLKLAQ